MFDVGRFEGGKVVEHWGVADQLGLLLQVGFDPRALSTHDQARSLLAPSGETLPRMRWEDASSTERVLLPYGHLT